MPIERHVLPKRSPSNFKGVQAQVFHQELDRKGTLEYDFQEGLAPFRIQAINKNFHLFFDIHSISFRVKSFVTWVDVTDPSQRQMLTIGF